MTQGEFQSIIESDLRGTSKVTKDFAKIIKWLKGGNCDAVSTFFILG